MTFRKADAADIPAVCRIYADTHSAIERGELSVGWRRQIYPTEATARLALERGELFVVEDGGCVVGAAIINRQQVDVYEHAPWRYPAPDGQIMVLHTLVIDPARSGRGYGRGFVDFYETYALEQGCLFLRMDTNAINSRARTMYKHLGYEEIATVPCVFNGIPGVNLVLLEKKLSGEADT